MSLKKEIKTNGVVIIDDVSVSERFVGELNSLRTLGGGTVHVVNIQSLTKTLDVELGLFSFPKETLFVFPGNGGKKVESLLEIKYQGAHHVFAQRSWHPGSDPVVSVGEIFPEKTLLLNTKCVCVVDDVVSSGKTLEALHYRNAWKFPSAVWTAFCWVDRGKKPKGYSQLISACSVKHTSDPAKKVPINSLSNLISDVGMARLYAERNILDAGIFLKLLKAKALKPVTIK